MVPLQRKAQVLLRERILRHCPCSGSCSRTAFTNNCRPGTALLEVYNASDTQPHSARLLRTARCFHFRVVLAPFAALS